MIDIKKYTKGKCTLRWLIAVLCVLAVSCVRDGEDPMPDGPSAGNSVRVEILLRAPESGSISRALTVGDETRIDNVLVLFFRKDGMTLHSVAEGSKLTAKSDDDKTYTFETSFSVESALASEPFTCIVLANVADRYDADERRSWRLQTYNDLQAKLTQQVTDKLHTSNTGGFVMWGKANKDLIPSTPQQKLSVPLLRNVARVDVAVDEKVSNFTLSGGSHLQAQQQAVGDRLRLLLVGYAQLVRRRCPRRVLPERYRYRFLGGGLRDGLVFRALCP